VTAREQEVVQLAVPAADPDRVAVNLVEALGGELPVVPLAYGRALRAVGLDQALRLGVVEERGGSRAGALLLAGQRPQAALEQLVARQP